MSNATKEREEEDASCSLCKLDGPSVGPRYQDFRALFTLGWYISYDTEPKKKNKNVGKKKPRTWSRDEEGREKKKTVQGGL